MNKRILHSLIAFLAIPSLVLGDITGFAFAQAATPISTAILGPTPAHYAPTLRGLHIDPATPLSFEFILDNAIETSSETTIAKTLATHFMTVLTVPQKDLWVNLSPLEPDRIMSTTLAYTDLGRVFLEQDYLIKQFTASLTHPEKETGKHYWQEVYRRAMIEYGTTEIPLDSFHKVWIVPDHAELHMNESGVVIADSHLKVMLEKDYLLTAKSQSSNLRTSIKDNNIKTDSITTEVMRDMIVPIIEKEVNTGEHFAPLRQAYHAMLLGLWFKEYAHNHLVHATYVDQNKMATLSVHGSRIKKNVYSQYQHLYKDGLYNLIKEDFDEASQTILPRRYFSGGLSFNDQNMTAFTTLRSLSGNGLTRLFTQNNTPKHHLKINLKPKRALGVIMGLYMITAGSSALAANTERSMPDSNTLNQSTVSMQIEIEKGDTLWGIASTELAKSTPNIDATDIQNYIDDIVDLNPGLNPNQINIGQLVNVPNLNASANVVTSPSNIDTPSFANDITPTNNTQDSLFFNIDSSSPPGGDNDDPFNIFRERQDKQPLRLTLNMFIQLNNRTQAINTNDDNQHNNITWTRHLTPTFGIAPPTPSSTKITTTQSSDPVTPQYHTIKRGETLSALARIYDVPWQNIQQANRIQNLRNIQIGQRLVIPTQANTRLTQNINNSRSAVFKDNNTRTSLSPIYNIPIAGVRAAPQYTSINTRNGLVSIKTLEEMLYSYDRMTVAKAEQRMNMTFAQMKQTITNMYSQHELRHLKSLFPTPELFYVHQVGYRSAESGWNANALSHKDAYGPDQMTKIAWRQVNQILGTSWPYSDRKDPTKSLMGITVLSNYMLGELKRVIPAFENKSPAFQRAALTLSLNTGAGFSGIERNVDLFLKGNYNGALREYMHKVINIYGGLAPLATDSTNTDRGMKISDDVVGGIDLNFMSPDDFTVLGQSLPQDIKTLPRLELPHFGGFGLEVLQPIPIINPMQLIFDWTGDYPLRDPLYGREDQLT